jgi:hypothetical protein
MTASLILHTLRCVGFADLARVADAAGLTEPVTESHLIDLAVDNLVTRTPPPFAAWGLTDAGRAEDALRTAGELDAAGCRPAVAAAYAKFMILNPELLELCSAWQMRPVDGMPEPNDHADSTYDTRVLRRIVDLDHRVDPVCTELAARLPRFRRYRERLTTALERAHAGDLDEVADSTTSYHAVWFQLHEDLLATLGLPRR